MQANPTAPMTLDGALGSLLAAMGKGGGDGNEDGAALFASLLDNGLGETVETHNEGQQAALAGDSDEAALLALLRGVLIDPDAPTEEQEQEVTKAEDDTDQDEDGRTDVPLLGFKDSVDDPRALMRLVEQFQRVLNEAGPEPNDIGTADGLTDLLRNLGVPEAEIQQALVEVATDETGAGDLDPLTRLLLVAPDPAITDQSSDKNDRENVAALLQMLAGATKQRLSDGDETPAWSPGDARLIATSVGENKQPGTGSSGEDIAAKIAAATIPKQGLGLSDAVTPSNPNTASHPTSDALSGPTTTVSQMTAPSGVAGSTPEAGNLAGGLSEQYEQLLSEGGGISTDDSPTELVIKAAAAGPNGDGPASPGDKPKSQAGSSGTGGSSPTGAGATFTQTAGGAQPAGAETASAQAGNPSVATAATAPAAQDSGAFTLGPGFEAMADLAWQQRPTVLNSSALLAGLDFGFGAQTVAPSQFSQGGFGGGFAQGGSSQGGDGQAGNQSGGQSSGQSGGNDGAPSENQFTQSLDLVRRGGDQLETLFNKSELNRAAQSQINFAVQRALQSGQSQFVLQLNPKELGQIEVRMQFEQNRLKLKVITERADTMEILKADSSLLERMFQDAGIESSAEDFEFTYFGADPETDPQRQQDGSGTGAERSQQPVPERLAPPAEPRRWTPMGVSFLA